MGEPEYRPHDVGWTPEKVARIWGYYASNPSYRGQYFSAHSGASIADEVERRIGLRGRRVLDFGCGRGDLLAHLFARGIAASGLELDDASADETQARFADEPLFAGIERAPGLPSGLASGSFERILLVEVVEHLLDDQIAATLAEVRRLLAPRGHVVVTAPNAEDLAASEVRCPDCGGTFHRWQHQRSLTPGTIAALFAEHGFETVIAEGTFWGLTPLARLRTRLRRPRAPLPQPHLLFVGR
ncbi:MAG: class I SAM-dependent methyltransferase [Gaiellaceae bacterium]